MASVASWILNAFFISGLLVTSAPTVFAVSNAGALMFKSPPGYSSKSYNASATPTASMANKDFSDQALAFLWDQVGPVATGPVTTTVSPTPEPSSYPKPGVLHPLIPSYDTKLASIQLPKNCRWGVA